MALDKQRDSVLSQMPTVKTHFLQFLAFQRGIFRKLLHVQLRKVELLENDYYVKPEGHLVLVTCGHRGQPNRSEEKRISRLMRKSGFIPMLEEISQLKREQEKNFEKIIDQEEKKTNDSVEKAQLVRGNSRGKGAMPNIKVVMTPKRSPLQDIVIDFEETVNPLG